MVRVQRPTSIGSELGPRRTRVMAQSHATRRTVSAVMGCDQSSSPAGAPGSFINVAIGAVTERWGFWPPTSGSVPASRLWRASSTSASA